MEQRLRNGLANTAKGSGLLANQLQWNTVPTSCHSTWARIDLFCLSDTSTWRTAPLSLSTRTVGDESCSESQRALAASVWSAVCVTCRDVYQSVNVLVLSGEALRQSRPAERLGARRPSRNNRPRDKAAPQSASTEVSFSLRHLCCVPGLWKQSRRHEAGRYNIQTRSALSPGRVSSAPGL